MVELRLNFERTRNILELMKQREKLKQERIQLMRSAFEVQLQMLQKQAKEDPNAEREVHSQFLQDEPPATRVMPSERPQRLRMPQNHQFNPYERGFTSEGQRTKRSRPEPEPEPERERDHGRDRERERDHDRDRDRDRGVAQERAAAPKSGGKLKPQKKRVMLAGHRNQSSGSAAQAAAAAAEPPPRAPPVMRVIRSLVNKDTMPVDFHQVHDSGRFVDPMEEGRDWGTFRYTSRGRVGRGGRIIFDRTMVKDRMDDPRYGAELVDWNVINAASLKLWTGDSVAADILRKRKLDVLSDDTISDDPDGAPDTVPVTNVTSAS